MHNDVKQCFRGPNMHCGSCSFEQIQYGVVLRKAYHNVISYHVVNICLQTKKYKYNTHTLSCLMKKKIAYLRNRFRPSSKAVVLAFEIGILTGFRLLETRCDCSFRLRNKPSSESSSSLEDDFSDELHGKS